MRVLFYNWVDYLDPEGRGGGVSLYQRNLIAALGGRDDVDATFLCSGISYDLFCDTPRWERMRHGPRRGAAPAAGPGGGPGTGASAGRRFEIVNSRCLAPSHHAFGHETQLDCPETRAAFLDFCAAQGPFDIVHFNNLEGLPASVLTLKERFPDTRVVFTLHNYYPFCAQVNLWHAERAACTDFEAGRACVRCLPVRTDTAEVRQANAVAYRFKRAGLGPGTRAFRRLFPRAVRLAAGAVRRAAPLHRGARAVRDFPQRVRALPAEDGLLTPLEPEHRHHARRRARFAALINAGCDRVLCVSARVAEIAERHGLERGLLQVLPIGTAHAERWAQSRPRPVPAADGSLTLGFLGYMRRDKGFDFLLDALAGLSPAVAARVHLVVAARPGPPETMARLCALGGHLASVRHAPGYAQAQLDTLLAGVDVGVVPAQWEDTLPQVAIEMHARRIPLITSRLGGAQELGGWPPMTFPAGDAAAFGRILRDLLDGRVDLAGYWRGARPPVTIPDHVHALTTIYRHLAAPEAGASGG